MADYEFIRFSRKDGRADMILNSPPRNFLSTVMLEEIVDALDNLRDDVDLKVLYIRGASGVFCGGVEIVDLTAEKIGLFMPLYTRMYIFLNSIRGLIVSAVAGQALGPGCELAAFSDITFAAKNAEFGFPEISYGLFPPIAAAIMPRISGRNRTLDWIISARKFSAQEALEANLVTRTIAPGELADFTEEFVTKISNLSAPAVILTKKAVDGALYSPAMEAMRTTESTYMAELMTCLDPHEGLRAGIEGRQPNWKNR